MLTVNAVEVQKHRLKGPVGYTVVGSPTIVDGVVSGQLDGQNHIRVASNFSSSYTNYEILIKAKRTSGAALLTQGNGTATNLKIFFYANKIAVVPDRSAGEIIDIDVQVDSTKYYYVRFRREGNTGFLSYSTNGTTFTEEVSKDVTNWNTSNAALAFGTNSNYGVNFNGSIDLNETYIKVNGKLWFYQPADTKYIVKDGKLVWADPRLSLSGPVNYEVVGNPTIVDGVASGFSNSSLLKTSFSLSSLSNVEYVVKCNFSSTSGITRPIGYLSRGTACGLFLNNGLFGLIIGRDNSNNLFQITTSYNVLQNTWYWMKALHTNNSVIVSISTNGIDFSQVGTLSDINTSSILLTEGTNIGIGGDIEEGGTTAYRYMFGSIDLKETYIKVNDQLWFYGKNYATQNIAPVPAGYTFGNTTTPSIGYVDMRTQAFTAAPTGATIGRDE